VTRWLAGAFERHEPPEVARLARALAPHAATVLAEGPLQVAYSGAAHTTRDPLCLLDGYLDNAAELRAQLGVAPDASSEELLAVGWTRWGRRLPARLRGEFALLVWDPERGEGLLARDQLGVRSMFLYETATGVRFAGEIRHLLALLPRRPAPDPVSVAHWLAMSSRPGSATLYAGIRRLDPGTMLLFARDGIREEGYWAPRFREPLAGSPQEIAERVGAALDLAVQRRISPDGHTGVLMSGGLDSASVAAVAARSAPGRVSAYAAVFPEHPAVDESALIAELRADLALPGITAEVRAGGLLASAVEAVEDWQLPLRSWGDFWALPLLRAAAATGVRVILGGDGGDELFGPRSYLLADRLRAGHPLQALRLTRELPGAGDRPARRDLAEMAARMALLGALPYRLHRHLQRPLASRQTPAWLNVAAKHDLHDSADPLAWKRLAGPRWWASVAHGLTRGIEETGVFDHQRRRAASAGLQARHPLFDLDLLELALRQPPLATFDRYRNRPILRRAMSGSLPDAVRLRPQKALFDALIVDCLAGPDGAAAQELLSDPAAEIGAYVDRRALRRSLFDYDRQRREQPFRWMWQVWRLTAAECWLRAQADPDGGVLPAGVTASASRLIMRDAKPPNASRDASAAATTASYVFPP
jgi:asparagine synthase (glutamine-hydrolysing)